LSQTLTSGATGRVSFDDNGDRLYAEYHLVNTRRGSSTVDVIVGAYDYNQVSAG